METDEGLRRNDGGGEGDVRWTILLVDDEPTQRLIMARLLKRAGYKVEVAGNGREALDKLRSIDVHIMITDWEMPEMDGLALCRALRSRPGASYVYAVILAARDSIEHVVAALQSGADDYLTKPVIEPELIARLHTSKRILSLERNLRALVEQNRLLAITHPLTGVWNRRYLLEQLPRSLKSASKLKAPLCIVLCDVDLFKGVNDRFGHTVGSDLLVAVAGFLNDEANSAGGWLAHYGGDEFAMVLPEMLLSVAGQFAERVCLRLSKQSLQAGAVEIRITASFGVSGFERATPAKATMDHLMRVADECMYASKAQGRNQVSSRQYHVDDRRGEQGKDIASAVHKDR